VKLYLDNSFLNRPFDDPSIGKNKLEADALYFVIQRVEVGDVQIVNSTAIVYENSRNPRPDCKEFIEGVMKGASEYIDYTEEAQQRADTLTEEYNLTLLDARHIAIAETAYIDFFITCDHTIIKRYKGEICVVDPLSFIQSYENSN